MVDIGDVSIKVKVDKTEVDKLTKDIQAQMSTAGTSVDNLGKKASNTAGNFDDIGKWGKKAGADVNAGMKEGEKWVNSLSNTLQSVGKKIAAVFAIWEITWYFQTASTEAIDFNNAITRISTVANGTKAELSGLKEEIKSISVETGMAQQKLADTAFYIASAGVAIKDIPNVLQQTAKFAVAAGTDTTVAFSGMYSIIQAYGMQLSQLTNVSDLFFRANAQGQLTVEGLAQNIGKVAPLANLAGVSINELIASYSTLVGVTGNAENVTTQIAGLLRAVSAPTIEASKGFKALWIEVGQAAIAKKGLSGVLDDIIKKTNGSAEVLRILIPEYEGLTAAIALGGKQSETYKKNLDDLAGAFGDTQKALEKYTETEEFKLQQSQRVWDNWKLSVGNATVKVIAGIIQAAEDVPKLLQIIWVIATSFFNGVFRNQMDLWGKFWNNIIKVFENISYDIGQVFKNIPAYIISALSYAIGKVEGFLNGVIASYNKFADLMGASSMKIAGKVDLWAKSLTGVAKMANSQLRDIFAGTQKIGAEDIFPGAKKWLEEIAKITSSTKKAQNDLLKKQQDDTARFLAEQEKKRLDEIAKEKENAELMKKLEASRLSGKSAAEKSASKAATEAKKAEAQAEKEKADAEEKAIKKVKDAYDSLQSKEKELDNLADKYHKANMDRYDEYAKALNDIDDKIKKNEETYKQSLKNIASEAQKRSTETTASYVRDQATRQVELEKTIADLDKQVEAERAAARAKGEAVDEATLEKQKKIEQDIAEAKLKQSEFTSKTAESTKLAMTNRLASLQAELNALKNSTTYNENTKNLISLEEQRTTAQKQLVDVKSNLANLSATEGKEAAKILATERERAALSTEKRAEFDYKQNIQNIKDEQVTKEAEAKATKEAQEKELVRQQQIYEFFQKRTAFTREQLAYLQTTAGFTGATGEEQNLINKLANELILITDQKNQRLAIEKEIADTTQNLSDLTTQNAIANVRALKAEYQELLWQIQAAIRAQQALRASAQTAQGFAEGGYTGEGGKYDVAGVVHKGEYVLSQNMLSKLPGIVPALEQVRHGNVSYDQSRKVEITGPISMNSAIDFEKLLSRAKFRL